MLRLYCATYITRLNQCLKHIGYYLAKIHNALMHQYYQRCVIKQHVISSLQRQRR